MTVEKRKTFRKTYWNVQRRIVAVQIDLGDQLWVLKRSTTPVTPIKHEHSDFARSDVQFWWFAGRTFSILQRWRIVNR